MGRPKSDAPKEKSVRVRFDDNQYDQLVSYCERHNTSKAEAIRSSVKKLLEEDETDETSMEKKD